MFATCGMIAAAIEKLAPLELAEAWDNVGLLVGSADREVRKALIALDVTETVIEEAAAMGAEMIISHHPFPFHAMKSVITDTVTGALLAKLLIQDISVYSAHTNLDAATGGVNDALAMALQLREVLPLRPEQRPLVKIVTYVPAGNVESVWQAMSAAGAGHIGNYSQCAFRVKGTGTFFPGENAHPYVGVPLQLSTIEEVRIETVAPAVLSARIIDAMVDAHPYEEVAYDVYPLRNEWANGGLGRVGDLIQSLTLREFAEKTITALGVQGVRFVGPADTIVKRIAVCGGSGMELAEIARSSGAQVLVTGDIRYHEAKDALASGLCMVDAGHFGTEFPALKQLQEYLRSCSTTDKWGSQFDITRRQSDIWQYI